MKTKNHFHVFLLNTVIVSAMLVLCLTLFFLFAFDIFEQCELVIIIGYILMLIVLPVGLFIYSIIAFTPKISVDNQGLTKSLFGIKIKAIAWGEITCLKRDFNGTYRQWLFFSKSNIEKYSLTRCRLRRDNIYFYITAEKMKIVENNAPEFIREGLKTL